MDIFILIAIFAAINFFIKKKKREEEERRKRAALHQQQAAATQSSAPTYSAQKPPARVPDARFPDYQTPQSQRRPAPDPRFPDYQTPQSQRRPAPDPRFPDYQTPQSQRQPAPDARFPDIDDLFRKGASGLRNKLNAVSEAVAEVNARNLQERLDEIKRQEAQRKRKDAPVLQSHVSDNMQSHMSDNMHSHVESHIESHMESYIESHMDAPPAYSMNVVKSSDSDESETPVIGQASERRDKPRPAPAQPVQPLHKAISSLSRDREALIQSIVMSEILGKPKALSNR